MVNVFDDSHDQAKGYSIEASEGKAKKVERYSSFLFIIMAILSLFIIERSNYLLFHSLIELFASIIAFGIFLVVWNAQRFINNGYLLFLGIAYFFIGGLTVLHLLSYQGMGIFPSRGTNLATQLWIAMRYLESISLLLAPIFIRRRVAIISMLFIYSIVTILILVSINSLVFPQCFIEGIGLTYFKIISEYLICALLLVAAAILYLHRSAFEPLVVRLIIASILIGVLAEIFFTFYANPFSLANQLGHYLRLISAYMIYKATIHAGLRRPYFWLFRDLKQSEIALRKANIELENYAHTVSHDLKGPLSAIIGASTVLPDLINQPASPKTQADIQEMSAIIKRSAQKAVAFTNELLALAEAGQEPKETTEVDVTAVVTRIKDEKAEIIQAKKIDIIADADLGKVRAAKVHIYQLFANLIDNAIKHNDNEHPQIIITYKKNKYAGEHHYLVRDNGSGIPLDQLDKIFLPFFRGKRGGNGIGLSTVDKIVHIYHGEIKVTNENGACFSFYLKDLVK